MDGTELNPYCVVSLGVQETKTKTVKKTSEPGSLSFLLWIFFVTLLVLTRCLEWNDECKFSALGMNPLVDWFTISVKVLNSAQYTSHATVYNRGTNSV